MLKRNLSLRPEDTGLQTPPDTESDISSRQSEDGDNDFEEDEIQIQENVREVPVKTTSAAGYSLKKDLDREEFISQALASVDLD